MSEKLITITSKQGVADLIEYLADKDFCAFDTETTGVTEDAEVIGFSVCAEEGVAYYVITAAWDVSEQRLVYYETAELAAELCRALLPLRLIMHNGVFDCGMVARNYNVNLVDSFFCDTMILAHLIDENRRIGLKELGALAYGESAKAEQEEMKASVERNGGKLTKTCYELYKADPELMAKYGAKDAILTYNLFFKMIPELEDEGMTKFFFEDESMPLLRGPTYQLNTVGLKVDQNQLLKVKKEMQVEAMQLKDFIYTEIREHVAEKYPGDKPTNTFNIGSGAQLAWLLFEKLPNLFARLSDSGKDVVIALGARNPYSNPDKRAVIELLKAHKDRPWRMASDKEKEAKVRDWWTYVAVDAAVLRTLAPKYKWVDALLKYKKLDKMLGTYVEGIESKTRYGVIHPSFKQAGTTSGRYSSSGPNFQNLPRDDKRIKSCIVSRPGKVFVGADYSQLEPRVFASYSKDERLLACFKSGADFYSVIGTEVFHKTDCTLVKDDSDPHFFGNKYKKLRNISKAVALSATYGTTAHKLGPLIGQSPDEAQQVIDNYFDQYPSVQAMMTEAHDLVKKQGYVENLFGRKRRIPEAKRIGQIFGKVKHADLPYEARNLLNLAVNHRIQSTGASIMNRAAIQFVRHCEAAGIDAKIVLQCHDELVVECKEEDAEDVVLLLKDAMENTVTLPGVELLAEPKIAKNLAELK